MKVIIYHDTERLARRARRQRQPGETTAYRSIKDWNEVENDKFDEVIVLSEIVKELKAAKKKAVKSF